MPTKILCASVALLALLFASAPLGASLSGGADLGGVSVTTPTTLRELPEGVGNILPRPNSGTAPTGPNERGGWEQLMVFGLLFAAVGAVGLLAWRDIRRKRTRVDSTPNPAS